VTVVIRHGTALCRIDEVAVANAVRIDVVRNSDVHQDDANATDIRCFGRHTEFHSYSVNQFNAGPNYLLSLASKVSASDVRSTDFSFSACHRETVSGPNASILFL
jgi:hypothetical protein